MKKDDVENAIESSFRKQVEKDDSLKNAYLLVDAQKAGIHINSAEGSTGNMDANSGQPTYMASVGKLFTATIIGILFENGKLSFDDKIAEYLDRELLKNLHVYRGKDYTDEIEIRHLLNQTSGLNDFFRPLLERLLDDPDCKMSPREAITWAKNNLKPYGPPGKKMHYTDTNYHLLGLIIENITGMAFHEVLEELIYRPLGMKQSSMLHYSEPTEEYQYPIADFYYKGVRLNDLEAYAGLDYAGGGVVATLEDLLVFMKALVGHQIVNEDTLAKMMEDRTKFNFGIDYGYGIWQIKTIPLLMPKTFNAWGVAGATGAFMFYHPAMDAYLIGTFNDFAYERKGIRYMMFKIIKPLSKCDSLR